MLEITEIRIALYQNDDRLMAFADVTLNDSFVIRGLKIIRGKGRDKRLFVAMPSRRRPDGSWADIAHPINRETRELLEKAVLTAFERERHPPTAEGGDTGESGRRAVPV
jgi:stage V sporulation protein G